MAKTNIGDVILSWLENTRANIESNRYAAVLAGNEDEARGLSKALAQLDIDIKYTKEILEIDKRYSK